jgi:hypothetical protein
MDLSHRRRIPSASEGVRLRRIEPHRQVERTLGARVASSPPYPCPGSNFGNRDQANRRHCSLRSRSARVLAKLSRSPRNRLMNQAKIGVVCGVDDGAPAILTEYMLVGLPVLANSALRCGLQYITPQTGRVAAAGTFHEGILEMLSTLPDFSPRQTVLDNWTWPHSVQKLRTLMKFSAY